MRVLVTGATGRLGPYVVRELEENGHEVIIFARNQPAGELSNKKWAKGDISDYAACRKATLDGIEAIQHCAAQPWPTDRPSMLKKAKESGLYPGHTLQVNVMGTYHMLQAAVEAGIRTFVMTGSNCVLGPIYRITERPFPFQYLPIDEAHPSEVEDSYSFSKVVDEQLLELYARVYNLRCHSVRAAGICNEQRRRQMAEKSQPVKNFSGGLFGWVGSEDVASAQRLLMEKAGELPAFGAYYCNSSETTCLEPTREVIEKTKPELLPLLKGTFEGHEALFSTKKLQEAVGWEHKTSWREYL